jgi:biopolymer transport protein ExbD
MGQVRRGFPASGRSRLTPVDFTMDTAEAMARAGTVGTAGLEVSKPATSPLKVIVSGALLFAVELGGTVQAEEPITIRLSSAQKSCVVADIGVDCGGLGEQLHVMQVPVDADIHLSVDADVRYEMTSSALESLNRAGYRKVGFMTESALPEITQLADAIARAKSTTNGSATTAPCPPHLEKLVGLTSHGIFEALGKPDYEQGTSGAPKHRQLSWSYFLRPPRRDNPKPEEGTVIVSSGGGYAVVTLHFGASKTVVRAECSLAR